jgi:opacity protein-like surface antigen
VFKNSGGGYSAAFGEDIKDNYLVDAGVGCYLTDHLRADLTVGYRSTTKLRDGFNSLSAKLTSYNAMINGYFDLGDFGAITPYVGAGIGVARNRVHSIDLPAGQSAGTNTSLAWALHAGASFQLSDNVSLDASYRYIDLGKTKSSSAVDPVAVEKIRAHDVRIGLRINFDD